MVKRYRGASELDPFCLAFVRDFGRFLAVELEDESDSDPSIDEDEDDDSSTGDFDFEAALNRIIRRQALRRRQNANRQAGIDADDEGENDRLGDLDDDEIDPDFNMEEAIDHLVNAVDEEIADEELELDDDDDDSGSWRTASQVGPEDINLDDLEEDEAREMENEEEEENGEVEEQEEEDEEEFPEEAPHADPALEHARQLFLARQNHEARERNNRGGAAQRRRNRLNLNLEQMLEARAVEQRAHVMEAIAREATNGQQQEQQNAHVSSDGEFQSEEEEINSVSTTALNPALRRRQRRRDSGL
uniref:Uncharacterized protein n=1 Tax=Caenorhabditis tropicalis TaxID=1561998 RepID=A0A1I7U6K7_9PELO